MRFLMLNWRDPVNPMAGGAERVSQGYLEALASRGHEVWWFANAFPEARPEESLGAIRLVRGGGKGSSVIAARRWFQRQPRFHLVIDQHHGIPWYAPWWCGTPVIAYIHEVLGPVWNVFYRWPWNVVGRWQERWTHRLYRNVPFWVPSESTARRLRGVGVRQVQVLPNGIDTRPLMELPAKPLTLPLRLVVVSRLSPAKRIDHAIDLVRDLQQRGIRSHLTIMGRGDAEEALKRKTTESRMNDCVTFTGAVSEAQKQEHLRQAHWLVHTSVREGWGLNVLEANAMGTPAAVYPVDGLIDSTVAGETGLVVGEETPRALADALAAASASPEDYERLRHRAWQRTWDYQWERVLPPACEWLESMASKPRGAASSTREAL